MSRPRRVPLKPLYTQADIEGIAHLGTQPGAAPFVRGPYASMYTARPWTIRQYAGYADAADSNLALRRALERGAQGLSIAFDLPTQLGYDSTDDAARADVGLTGVAIDTVEDMTRLFDGIALDRVSVSMTMNGAVLPVLAAFIVAAEERGIPMTALRGTVQNDILKEFMVRNTWVFAPQPSMRIVADVAQFLGEHMPRFNALSVSGYHFQEGGADASLELALTFSNAIAYVRALRERGLPVDDVCEQLSFFFGTGTDFYTEIAKLRAARLLWSRIAGDEGASTAKSRALRMHCQTSGWTLSATRTQNNIVRTTVEAMAAVFGGTQSLHTNAFDEALALPSASAAQLARDTQLILQHEMGLCDVIDPWAGSYMMESLTARLADRARAIIDEVEALGGAFEAIRTGWAQRKIREHAAAAQMRIDAGEQVIVGVNAFRAAEADQDEDNDSPACLAIDGECVRMQQSRRLADVKLRRDDRRLRATLAALTRAAREDNGNLLAATIECMRARATVGECTRALEAVWPRHAQDTSDSPHAHETHVREDVQWRAACVEVARLREKLGRKPCLLMAKLGLDGHDRGASVVSSALKDAGFDVTMTGLFASPMHAADLAAQLAAQERCDVIGVSSLGGAHMPLVLQLMRELERKGVRAPVVVGGIVPDAHACALRDAGVADVFAPGATMHAIIERLVQLIEVRFSSQHAARYMASSAFASLATVPSISCSLSSPNKPMRKVLKSAGSSH
ncbi:methylmalonyl-CoA mutase [Caballeronia fortuita]|uniref:Methylmalonyl-CoA mutase n=1 Tax=Caballeronia fortuita TaxID=1777138 RepID=A0A158DZ74_9BURK|nr:methylmalonyl-CoA mutase [Caballeronia fortuita]SAK99878.1 methylmalonyl-CoA mutase [Caballeronia fortuita]